VYRCDSCPQPLECLQHRAIEVAQPLTGQSSVKSDTDVGGGQPKLGVIGSVDHRILDVFQLSMVNINRKETHSDRRGDNANGTEKNVGWHDVRDSPREIHGPNGGIQREEGIFPKFLMLNIDIHGHKVNVARENVVQ